MTDVAAQGPFELYYSVGAVVVAGGHVEWWLQRMLLGLRGLGPAGYPTVQKLQWGDLVKQIREEVAAAGGPSEIVDLLDWAERERLQEMRHDVVHSYWWLTPGPGLRANRRPRTGSGWIIADDAEALFRLAADLFECARRLEELTPDVPGWVVAW
jgi:hypothetical protein